MSLQLMLGLGVVQEPKGGAIRAVDAAAAVPKAGIQDTASNKLETAKQAPKFAAPNRLAGPLPQKGLLGRWKKGLKAKAPGSAARPKGQTFVVAIRHIALLLTNIWCLTLAAIHKPSHLLHCSPVGARV